MTSDYLVWHQLPRLEQLQSKWKTPSLGPKSFQSRDCWLFTKVFRIQNGIMGRESMWNCLLKSPCWLVSNCFRLSRLLLPVILLDSNALFPFISFRFWPTLFLLIFRLIYFHKHQISERVFACHVILLVIILLIGCVSFFWLSSIWLYSFCFFYILIIIALGSWKEGWIIIIIALEVERKVRS